MSIFNRRNAVVGWATMLVAKKAARRKLKAAAPTIDVAKASRRRGRKPKAAAVEAGGSKRRGAKLIAFLTAAGVGIAGFLRARAGRDDESQ